MCPQRGAAVRGGAEEGRVSVRRGTHLLDSRLALTVHGLAAPVSFWQVQRGAVGLASR